MMMTIPGGGSRAGISIAIVSILSLAASVRAATFNVAASGLAFSPNTLTIHIGDVVNWSGLSADHNVTEVDQATWNSNGTTALPGGFGSGIPGSVSTFDWAFSGVNYPPGTYYYVCQAHGSVGMKGRIIVVGPGPANDLFADRIVITGPSGQTLGTNVGAIKEPGEPNHFSSGGASVWWEWTAPSSGFITLDTIGSNFDTLLGVYTGDSLSSLAFIASDDDSGGNTRSLVRFPAVAGTSYKIAVDGYLGATGNTVLNWAPNLPPANDDFANRFIIGGASGSTSATNIAATKEPGEPDHAAAGGASVWWEWTPTSSGPVSFNTRSSNFDTLLAVYTGDSVDALTPIAVDDNSAGIGRSNLRFSAVAGVPYKIAVDGAGGVMGSVFMSWNPTPPNDNFADRTLISGLSGITSGNNIGATREPDEPANFNAPYGASIWWEWTAPATMTASFDTNNGTFAGVTVYTGDALSGLTLIGSAYPGSSIQFQAIAGTSYKIAVDSFSSVFGSLSLRWGFPGNDNFPPSFSYYFSTVSGQAIGFNRNASKQVGEPNHAGNAGGASVWWNWYPPASGEVTFDTIGSGFNTLLAVYTGFPVDALTEIASDDDSGGGGASRVTFIADSSQLYRIAVDGFGGATGDIALNWAMTVASNNMFADRLPISGDTGQITANNLGATKEDFEPYHAGYRGGASVWWEWTCPATGYYRFVESGSYESLLAIYTGSGVASLVPVSALNLIPNSVLFVAMEGSTYQIAVDCMSAGVIEIDLGWSAQPVNDPFNFDGFAGPIPLNGHSGQFTGWNGGATKEANEPDHAGSPGGASVWWNWVAPRSGETTIHTIGSGFDTLLAVYTGDSVADAVLVAADDNSGGGGASYLTFAAIAGTTYHIAVDGSGGATGSISLNWAIEPPNVVGLFQAADRMGFGGWVRGIPDIDGDNRGDFLINDLGGPFEGGDLGTEGGGGGGWFWQLHLYSGATQSLIRTFGTPTEDPWDGFGASAVSIPDTNGDGKPDILVSAPFASIPPEEYYAGAVYLFDGATGEPRYGVQSPNPESYGYFGISLAGLPDVDGDGKGDFLVGAHETLGELPSAGRAYVFSGAGGGLIRSLISQTPQDYGYFGESVSGVPDITGDGVTDLAIGAPNEDVGENAPQGGRAYLFDGRTGEFIRDLISPSPQAYGYFGQALAGIDDLSGDGRGEVAVAAPGEYFGRASLNSGRVYVFDGSTGEFRNALVRPGNTADSLQNSGMTFGISVSSVPDLDGDQLPDFLVGETSYATDGDGLQSLGVTVFADPPGRAHVFNGASGQLLQILESPNPKIHGQFGFSVSGVPDTNGDGYGDLLVGAPSENDVFPYFYSTGGRAYLFTSNLGPPRLNDAEFVTHTIPPTMLTGQSTPALLTFRNIGNTTWTNPDYYLAVLSDPCGLFGGINPQIGAGDSVAPDMLHAFTPIITAPATPGVCAATVQMIQNGVEFFGPRIQVRVDVVMPTPTPSATPTASVTQTPPPSPSPSPSPSPTASMTPSASPSASPSPSETPSPSPSPTPSATETPSPSPTESASPTPTESPTPSPTISASPTQIPESGISVIPPFLIYPARTINGGPSSAQSVIISNVENRPLTLINVVITGTDAADFIIVSDTGETTLGPGESRTIRLVFDPNDPPGGKAAALAIESDDPINPFIAIPVTGTAQTSEPLQFFGYYPENDHGRGHAYFVDKRPVAGVMSYLIEVRRADDDAIIHQEVFNLTGPPAGDVVKHSVFDLPLNESDVPTSYELSLKYRFSSYDGLDAAGAMLFQSPFATAEHPSADLASLSFIAPPIVAGGESVSLIDNRPTGPNTAYSYDIYRRVFATGDLSIVAQVDNGFDGNFLTSDVHAPVARGATVPVVIGSQQFFVKVTRGYFGAGGVYMGRFDVAHPTAAISITGEAPVNDAIPMTNTVPEILAPGVSVGVGITFKNTGNTNWTPELGIALKVVQDTCPLFAVAEIAIRPGDVVVPGQSYQFIGQLTAPPSETSCMLRFQMEDSSGAFGGTMDVAVMVEVRLNTARNWEYFE